MSDVLLEGKVVKKEGSSGNSWVDPSALGSNLAVEFDRETQALRFVYKRHGKIGRGCPLSILFAFSFVCALVAIFDDRPTSWTGRAFIAVFGLLPLGIIPALYDRQIEIDTKARKLVHRSKGVFLPWTAISSTPIGDTARFEVRTIQDAGKDKPDHYILFFVPYPDAWFTWWYPTLLGQTSDPANGKTALDRLAFGLNRFLDAVRKGEPNLERLAQPAPPGPFKP